MSQTPPLENAAGESATDLGPGHRRPPKTAFSAGFTAHSDSAASGQLSSYRRVTATLRWTLPVVALALAAGLISLPSLYGESVDSATDLGEDGRTDNSLRMTNPRYRGQDSRNRPFEITADLATQDKLDPDRLTLEGLQADITLTDGTWLNLEAAAGRYDRVNQVLYVEDRVNIFSDRGYELNARDFTIDLRAGTASSEEPVTGQGPMGRFEAKRFRMTDFGKHVTFEDVTLVFWPDGAG